MNHDSSENVSSRGRRVAGLAAAALLLAGAGAVHVAIGQLGRGKVNTEARRQAAETSRRLPDVWAAQTEALGLLARSASTNPPFTALVRSGIDEQQMMDLTGDEWWAPYRATRAAVSYDGQTLAVAQDREAAVVAVELLAEPVRQNQEVVVRALVSNRRPLLVAGAPVTVSRRVAPAMVMLSQPLDRALLSAVSARLGAPVLLEGVDGELGAGGSPDDVARLTAAIRRGGLDVAGEIPWAASAVPVGQGLWLWTGATPADFARELVVTELAVRMALWSLALVVSAVALMTAWRRPPARQVSAPVEPSRLDDRVLARLSSPGTGIFLGRYELLERIGEGGMAEIFAAASFGANGFRRFFVIKRLRSELVSNQDAVAHFIDEANLGSTLNHPNIVPVFDFGEMDGTYYLAEEYVLGRDLNRLRRRMAEDGHPPLSARAVLYVLDQLLAALEYAHDKCDEDGAPLGIVHRDVTPANILVSATGEVKLLDFGIVKTSRGRLARTQVGQVNGNFEFMAPEQARSQPVDARTDLFSAGLVAYFAATADRLYRGETLLDLLNRAACGPGVDEIERFSTLPAPLPELLDKTLAVEPAERFQSAAAFRAAIARHLDGGKAELAAAMAAAFAEDLRLEQERLNRACPRAVTPAPVAA
jgi:hypothetical protein